VIKRAQSTAVIICMEEATFQNSLLIPTVDTSVEDLFAQLLHLR
jgi:hypothetical protein